MELDTTYGSSLLQLSSIIRLLQYLIIISDNAAAVNSTSAICTEAVEYEESDYRLLPVHALIEVLKLQLALLLGTGLPDAMRTFDPLLLEGVAACRPLVGLLSALQQQPAVQVDTEPRLQIHERHDAERGEAQDRERLK